MSSSSNKLAAWLALVSVVCFLVLIGLQAFEMVHYGADPSVWP
ncbi:MAG TPA: hypothetical protein P5567_00315 [Kiritimatiellia bacterium]|nr:hypothetical protein [Kiritimatiellia bacterium]HSA18849.1 hypothetical protein [Kiritimatiellia bacterium]